MKTVTVFGSSLPSKKNSAYQEARRLGRLLAEAGYAVCNGGYGGLMEATSRGAREGTGHTIGVTCTLWPNPANPYVIEQISTETFPERLMTLIERGDAYIALPGGTGTLAELALAWELMNKGSLRKTVGGRKPLLAMAPYWQPVIHCLQQEADLNDTKPGQVAASLEAVTLFETPEQAVVELKKTL